MRAVLIDDVEEHEFAFGIGARFFAIASYSRIPRVRRAVIGGLWWAMTSHVYSFMPANAVLRCQSNRADRSSRAAADGAVGMDL